MKKLQLIIAALLLSFSCVPEEKINPEVDFEKMMIRIAELEIAEEHLDSYLFELKKEAKASMDIENGVISIFPMYKEEHPTQITIVEIYADKKAYEAHLKTPHFKTYKTTTMEMVKSLKLIDMNAVDPETMPLIFEKLNPDSVE